MPSSFPLRFATCRCSLSRCVRHAGGKGTPRRKVVKKSVASLQADDKKLQLALKKLNVAPINGVEEVNMFQQDGNVLHFSAPKGTYAFLSSSSPTASRAPLSSSALPSLPGPLDVPSFSCCSRGCLRPVGRSRTAVEH